MDLRIESRNVAMRSRWKTTIEERMADLQDGHHDITHCHVSAFMKVSFRSPVRGGIDIRASVGLNSL